MSIIRDDVFGVVAVDGIVLKAGDEVPEGIVVGSHLIVPDTEPEPELEPETASEASPEPEPELEAEAPAEKPAPRARRGRK